MHVVDSLMSPATALYNASWKTRNVVRLDASTTTRGRARPRPSPNACTAWCCSCPSRRADAADSRRPCRLGDLVGLCALALVALPRHLGLHLGLARELLLCTGTGEAVEVAFTNGEEHATELREPVRVDGRYAHHVLLGREDHWDMLAKDSDNNRTIGYSRSWYTT